VDLLLLLALGGCGLDFDFSLPSNEPGPDQPALPGLKFKVRERVLILPGTDSRLPPPEPGVVADDCERITEGGPVSDDCVTADISCGETLVGHTLGGVQRYDSRFYNSNFCTPAITDHDGGDERIYRLRVPDGDWTAFVTLDTPCADLDVGAMLWADETCPPSNANITRCDMWPKPGNERERLTLVTQHEAYWFLYVEGKGGEEGAFSLSVQCRPGLW
jgi:hypothetical protein